MSSEWLSNCVRLGLAAQSGQSNVMQKGQPTDIKQPVYPPNEGNWPAPFGAAPGPCWVSSARECGPVKSDGPGRHGARLPMGPERLLSIRKNRCVSRPQTCTRLPSPAVAEARITTNHHKGGCRPFPSVVPSRLFDVVNRRSCEGGNLPKDFA